MIKFLEGKKTHITAFVMAVLNFLNVMEWVKIDQEQINAINVMLVALMGMFIRLGVKNEIKNKIFNVIK